MYVNYCISLEVIWWSWISAEHQVDSFLLSNQSIDLRVFFRLYCDKSHINLLGVISLAPILNRNLQTCAVAGPEFSARYKSVKPALMSSYHQCAVQDLVCWCEQSRVVSLSRWCSDAPRLQAVRNLRQDCCLISVFGSVNPTPPPPPTPSVAPAICLLN